MIESTPSTERDEARTETSPRKLTLEQKKRLAYLTEQAAALRERLAERKPVQVDHYGNALTDSEVQRVREGDTAILPNMHKH